MVSEYTQRRKTYPPETALTQSIKHVFHPNILTSRKKRAHFAYQTYVSIYSCFVLSEKYDHIVAIIKKDNRKLCLYQLFYSSAIIALIFLIILL